MMFKKGLHAKGMAIHIDAKLDFIFHIYILIKKWTISVCCLIDYVTY